MKSTTIKLYEVNQNGNKFCGPSAISAIAGIGTKEAAMLLRKVGGRTKIFGTHPQEMIDALRLIGFRLTPVLKTTPKYGTMRAFAKKYAKAKHTYLIDAGHHWEVLQDKAYVICGLTKVMVHIEDHKKVQSQIKTAYLIERIEKVDVEEVVEQHKPKEPSRNAEWMRGLAAKRKTKRLIKEYHLGCDDDFESSSDVVNGTIMIYPPNDLFKSEDDDPHAWDHVCYGWVAALALAEEYVAIIEKKKKKVA